MKNLLKINIEEKFIKEYTKNIEIYTANSGNAILIIEDVIEATETNGAPLLQPCGDICNCGDPQKPTPWGDFVMFHKVTHEIPLDGQTIIYSMGDSSVEVCFDEQFKNPTIGRVIN